MISRETTTTEFHQIIVQSKNEMKLPHSTATVQTTALTYCEIIDIETDAGDFPTFRRNPSISWCHENLRDLKCKNVDFKTQNYPLITVVWHIKNDEIKYFTRGDCASFQAIECSRPPLPIIRTRLLFSFLTWPILSLTNFCLLFQTQTWIIHWIGRQLLWLPWSLGLKERAVAGGVEDRPFPSL
jgi:hypothetical protein